MVCKEEKRKKEKRERERTDQTRFSSFIDLIFVPLVFPFRPFRSLKYSIGTIARREKANTYQSRIYQNIFEVFFRNKIVRSA